MDAHNADHIAARYVILCLHLLFTLCGRDQNAVVLAERNTHGFYGIAVIFSGNALLGRFAVCRNGEVKVTLHADAHTVCKCGIHGRCDGVVFAERDVGGFQRVFYGALVEVFHAALAVCRNKHTLCTGDLHGDVCRKRGGEIGICRISCAERNLVFRKHVGKRFAFRG